jgi:hypothetical protein
MAKSKAITRVSLKETHPIRRRNNQVEEAAAAGANCVEHEEKASELKFIGPGTNSSPHSGHSIRSKSIRLTSAGGIMRPHFGQTASSDACTFSRLTFRELGMVRGEISPTCCPPTVGGCFAFSSCRPHVGQGSPCSMSCLRIFQLARSAASRATCGFGTHLK